MRPRSHLSLRRRIRIPPTHTAPPTAARPHRESDDWVKPGHNVRLKGGIAPGQHRNTFRVVNQETFAWTLLDDIWLGASLQNGQLTPQGSVLGDRLDVFLRCTAPRTIPPGVDVEISFDACRATTTEPGPDASLTSYYIVAKEGYAQSHIEGGAGYFRDRKAP